MTDRPILFSAPMVRALLAGTKTQTRRILKVQPGDLDAVFCMDDGSWHVTGADGSHMSPLPVRYRVSDRLWVRETWMPRALGLAISRVMKPHYRADADSDRPEWRGLWKPSIFMPRWASRLTLTVTDVRVQRLQDISEEDAIAEGITEAPDGWWSADHKAGAPLAGCDARGAYYCLWNHINGPGSWDANPWIVAPTFAVERRNIDARPTNPPISNPHAKEA
jgi:hypothetical protein